MSKQNDLDAVVAELESRTGDLRKVADDTGIPYDTILRIKNRENDPAFSRVYALHQYLFPKTRTPTARAGDKAEPFVIGKGLTGSVTRVWEKDATDKAGA